MTYAVVPTLTTLAALLLLLQGSVTDMREEKVVQPLLVTSSALTLATECVRMILKVRFLDHPVAGQKGHTRYALQGGNCLACNGLASRRMNLQELLFTARAACSAVIIAALAHPFLLLHAYSAMP
jgi:hypothetical protein